MIENNTVAMVVLVVIGVTYTLGWLHSYFTGKSAVYRENREIREARLAGSGQSGD